MMVCAAGTYAQKVGIGTNAPTERLHIEGGNLRLEGAFKPGNQAGTAGQFLQSTGATTAPIWVNAPSGSVAGKNKYVARYSPTDNRLSYGLLQDDSMQVVVKNIPALPFNKKSFLFSSVANVTKTGVTATDTTLQRAGIYGFSYDSVAVYGFTSGAGLGAAVRGRSNSLNSGVSGVQGVAGASTGTTNFAWGVHGITGNNSLPLGLGTLTGSGVLGAAGSTGFNHGVQGLTLSDSAGTAGVYGFATPTTNQTPFTIQAGVFGETDAPNYGMFGFASNSGVQNNTILGVGVGVSGRTIAGGLGIGVEGIAFRTDDTTPNAGTTYGVWGETQNSLDEAAGVFGIAYQTIDVNGPTGGGKNAGVWGESYSLADSATGVFGRNENANTMGVYGRSKNGVGVVGHHYDATGTDPGVIGYTRSTDADANGILGLASGSGANRTYGIQAITFAAADDAAGLYGRSEDASNKATIGIFGETNSTGAGMGMFGRAGAATGQTIGVLGESHSADAGAAGIIGVNKNTGAAAGVFGVHGKVSAANATNSGVRGDNETGDNTGVSFAGWFQGNLHCTGILTKGTDQFKIDHPLDPENKYLYHTCPESPEALNIYSGNITTNSNGEAIVKLPDYYEAINKNPRYQLTCVNQFANAIVSQKIANNQFIVKTDKPNVEVSWVIYGERNDKFHQKFHNPVEAVKEPENKGKYVHPAAFDKPASLGIGYIQRSKTSPLVRDVVAPKPLVLQSKNTSKTANSAEVGRWKKLRFEQNQKFLEDQKAKIERNKKSDLKKIKKSLTVSAE